MPISISEIRAKFPMYADLPDDQLVIGLHRKYYSDIPFKNFNAQISYDNKSDPTEGMSSGQKLAAGFGKSLSDTARGLGQLTGLVSRQDVAEARKLDQSLASTTEGKIGEFAGNVATTLPLAFVPGANTVKGAALIGTLTGLAQPSESTMETVRNTAGGGAIGAASIPAGRLLGAGYQAVTGALRPLTKGGQQQVAAEVLQASATDPAKAVANIAGAKALVPGSSPTVGQVAADPGLAQLERTLLNNPETAGPLNKVYAAQQAAREKAIGDVAGVPGYRDLIAQGRKVFADQDYKAAISAGVDTKMAEALKPQIDNLLKRPSIKQAQQIAKQLAAEEGVALSDWGSVQGMHWLKIGLDNKITKASKVGSALGDAELRALMQTKADLMATLEQIAPAYKLANDNYAAMSKQINAMDVAKELQKKLYKNAQYGSGKEMGAAYQSALGDSIESVKKSLGVDVPLSQVMPTKDISTLEAIARDLSRKEAAQNMGRAVGSPTMQNMLGQNLVQRIVGPLGMPQSFGQSVISQTAARPYEWALKAAQPKISATLAEALADPAQAGLLLRLAPQPSAAGLLARKAERFLPVPGLLALEQGP